MKKSSNKGFTLVELIIVIAILAIIMLIAIPNFSGIQQRMQVRADKATAAQIGKAVRVWFTDYTTDATLAAGATGVLPKDVPAYASSTVTPIKYSTLAGITDYISEQKPSSLKKTDKSNDDTQCYGVFLTAAPTDSAAKIAIAICSEATTLTAITSTTVDYDGSKAGVAYVEP